MRYLKATILCGALATLLAVGLFELGAFRALDQRLAALLSAAPSAGPGRLPQYAVVVFFAFGIAWTTIDIARLSLKLLVAGAALFELITAVGVLNLYGHFFSPFAGVTAIVVAFAAGLAYSRSPAGRRKLALRQLLGERISGQMFNALLDSRESTEFPGEARQATIVVCEIFNHDTLLDALGTKDYVAMTNAFLRHAADFLVERGGYLDECDGESLRVIFGVPMPEAQHASRACDAALELQTRLDGLNRECEARWGGRFDFRVGINSGEVILAAYGSRRLAGVSVSGEPVEFARRLCAANTIYGSRILLGAATFAQAESTIEVRPMELIQRNREDPSREEVYELLAGRGEMSPDDSARRDLFWKGIVFFREQKWDDALTNFKLSRELWPEDGPSEFYIRRVEQLRAGVASLDYSKE